LVERDSEVVCRSCNLVVEEQTIDPGPGRHITYENGETNKRTGPALTEARHDRGLTTEISWRDADSNGNSLSSRKARRMHRLRRLNRHSKTQEKKERNIRTAFGEISRMASALGIPDDIQETGCVLYRTASREDLVKGRSIEAVATAALAIATRQHGHPVPLSGFNSVHRLSDDMRFQRCYRHLIGELNLEVEPVRPQEYLDRIIDDISIVSTEVTNRLRAETQTLLDRLTDDHPEFISGRDPSSVVAGALYVANAFIPFTVTQRIIAEAADVSQVTIRNRYTELVELDFTPDRDEIGSVSYVHREPQADSIQCKHCSRQRYFYLEEYLEAHIEQEHPRVDDDLTSGEFTVTESSPASTTTQSEEIPTPRDIPQPVQSAVWRTPRDSSTELQSAVHSQPRTTTDGGIPAIRRVVPDTDAIHSWDRPDTVSPLSEEVFTQLDAIGAGKAHRLRRHFRTAEALTYAVILAPDQVKRVPQLGDAAWRELLQSYRCPLR
jgi:transcription initiation factor TFIIB